MFEKLEEIVKRYDDLTLRISDPAVLSDLANWQKLAKEHASLEELVGCYKEYRKNQDALEECLQILKSGDKEMEELANEEHKILSARADKLAEQLKVLMLPKDPDDDKNVVMEIRGGAGGDEAALFAAQLMRMYMRFAERKRWKTEEIDINATELGGIKEAVFMISGKGAYSMLKYESGVHRVQRVPETESQGRVHTSTVTVAVLPEVEDVEVEIAEKDIKIDTYRSSGAGGQHVNKTESAIRITHLPTGIVVTCQDEKSQIKNRERAMKVLKSKLYDFYRSKADSEYAANRRAQVGTGDRSERIRTYNFPQGRVSDHRIGFTIYSLPEFLDGDMFEMIENLSMAAQNKILAEGQD